MGRIADWKRLEEYSWRRKPFYGTSTYLWIDFKNRVWISDVPVEQDFITLDIIQEGNVLYEAPDIISARRFASEYRKRNTHKHAARTVAIGGRVFGV